MPLAGRNDQLGGDTERSQCMPELIRLRSWTFCVAFADHDQGRGVDVFDETDGRTLLVGRRIVVNGRSEEGDHPLIDQVLAVITLPIRDACATYCSTKTVRLGNSP